MDKNKSNILGAIHRSGPGYSPGYSGEAACDNGPSQTYMPTIEERLQYMEEQAKYSIECAKKELDKVARVRAALKKNPALSDLYTFMKF
jgi:hypothetical protein